MLVERLIFTFTANGTIIIIKKMTLLISSKRLFSLIYNVKYLKLSFPKIPFLKKCSFILTLNTSKLVID